MLRPWIPEKAVKGFSVRKGNPCPKGLNLMVESEEFFTVGQGSILVRALPGAMGAP